MGNAADHQFVPYFCTVGTSNIVVAFQTIIRYSGELLELKINFNAVVAELKA